MWRLPLHLGVVAIEKGAFRSPTLLIYIYTRSIENFTRKSVRLLESRTSINLEKCQIRNMLGGWGVFCFCFFFFCYVVFVFFTSSLRRTEQSDGKVSLRSGYIFFFFF